MKVLLIVFVALFVLWCGDLLMEQSFYQPSPGWNPISARVIAISSPYPRDRVYVSYKFEVNGKSFEHRMGQRMAISNLLSYGPVQSLVGKTVLAYYEPGTINHSISPEIGRVFADGNSQRLGLICIGLALVTFFAQIFREMAKFGNGDGQIKKVF